MTIRAFKDSGDGYYEVDISEGENLPEWIVNQNLTERPLMTPSLTVNTDTFRKISELESTITARRLREAILGIDNGWLSGINEQMKNLRSELK